MTESANEFSKLIEGLPTNLKVLDVGAGGLDGENTTEYLMAHFEKVLGICSAKVEVERYQAWCKEQKFLVPEIIIGNFYEHKFTEKFDLIVLDLNIDNNLFDWSEEGLQRIKGMLNDGGLLINYIMTTEKYGNETTPILIKRRWQEFWESNQLNFEDAEYKLRMLKGWEFQGIIQEKRRDYILWAMLKKINGS